ncbi:MAG: U32 family peptidase, partial [Erysipelotrichaceae bacterium]|nr:U32 family peptidase [Erysipelotrichaceae bacterium]
SGIIVAARRFSSGIDETDLNDCIERIHASGKKAIVKVDRLYDQQELPDLEKYLLYLNELNADAIIFTDIGVFELMKQLKVSYKGIYAPETLLTNYYDIQDLQRDGIDNCVISKDIPIDDVYEISHQCPDYCYLRIHGPILISYSHRRFISSYLQQEKEYLDNYYLQEEKRSTLLPIVEKENGSWLYGTCLQSVGQIRKLMNEPFKGFIIDNVMYDDSYTISVLKMYTQVIEGKISPEEALEMLSGINKDTEYTAIDEIKETVLDKQ